MNKINKNFNNFIKLRNSYKKNGFVVIKQLMTKKQTQDIKDKINDYFEKDAVKLKGRKINFTNNLEKINSIHSFEKVLFVKKLISSKIFKKIATVFVGEKIKSIGAELFAKPAKEGMAVPIHQDNYYWNINNSKGITIWISLDDSNKKNGCVFYYKSSHLIGIQEHENSYVSGSSQKIKNDYILKKFKKFSPSLKTGDIIVHNCEILHGSNKNKSNKSRLGLTLRYIPKKSKINKDLKIIYEKRLYNQMRLRKHESRI